MVQLAGPDEDLVGALMRVADRLGLPVAGLAKEPRTLAGGRSAALDPRSVGAVVAEALPQDALVVEEAGTSAFGYNQASPTAARHTVLGLPGGSIGMGLPVSIGASVAAPGRRVVALQADGSAMYTVQSLWTLAREALDVTVVLLANRKYAVLGTELERAGFAEMGETASSLIDLASPAIDWVGLAHALGVPASRPTSVEELRKALEVSLGTPGPTLIEVVF
jgi:acetolactate synthase-1/2/3 large subunit